MMQASKTNESVSDSSKTGYAYYGCYHEETHESHLNVTGVQFFRLQIRTEISHGLGLQKSTTNQIRLHEMVV